MEKPVNISEKIELLPEEQEKIVRYKNDIDINNRNSIISYGTKAQMQLVSFSTTVLDQLKNKDIGEVGGVLSDLMADLKTFDKSINRSGLFSFFMSIKKKIIRIKAEYTKVEKNVAQVEVQLEKHSQTLLKDINLFDKLYSQNEQYYRELSLYIQAGDEKTEEFRAELSSSETDDVKTQQEKRLLEQQVNQLEKKVHDLKISRMICLQLAPQIRLVQNNSSVLMERIQSSISNTLPLWRNQMVLSLGLLHSQQALQAQHAVNEATNKMLVKNSRMLKDTSTKIAQENERSIVDLNTLRQVNDDLFTTIDNVLTIQKESRSKRLEAEKELLKIEGEFKTKIASL